MWLVNTKTPFKWCGHMLGWSLIAGSAFAQALPIDALIRQHERAVQDATRREPLNADVLSPDAPEVASSPRSAKPPDNCRVIQTVRLEGHPDAAGGDPQVLIRPYVGRCLVADEVNALLGDLNRWYQKRGFTTTRAYAAEQDLTQGELVLRIITGRIDGYRYIDRPADDRLAAAFPGQAGDVLNVRDLEQGLENFNRIPSQEAKFQLYPGREPGTSDVVVELVEKKTWRVTAMVDNSGNKSMGHWRSNTELALDNLLLLNDQLALGYNRNLDDGQLSATFEGLTLNYLISNGYHLFGVSAASFLTNFTAPGINQSYALRTSSNKAGLSYEYLFARDQSSKHSVISGLDYTSQHSYSQDFEISSQQRRLSVFYWGVKGKHYLGNKVWDWQLRADQGTGLFDAMSTIPGGTDPRYSLTKAQTSLSVPLPENMGLWRSSFQWQSGKTTTPNLAQLYVGSRYNVRGFQDNSLFGSTGAWWRNDVESRSLNWGAVTATPYIGFDAGHVKPNASQSVSQHHLVGYALGLRVEQGKFKTDIAFTRAVSRPEEFNTESRERWLVHLSVAL
jgi:hemolysin activation/secretion protein